MILLLPLFFGPLFAQSTPQVIKLQGSLIQSGVGPVTGNVTMTLTLHDAPAGGLPLATVGPLIVAVSNGLYAVELPFPASVFGGANRYVEITVNGEMLTPRIQLGSSAFAYVAETVDGRHAGELEESVEIDEKVASHEANPDPHPVYVLRSGDSMAGNLQVVGVIESLVGGFRFPDGSFQTTAAGAGSGGSTAFHFIASGINTAAAMVVGPGASLSAAGGGTIAATSAPGYLPLAGGEMTGTQTTRTGGTALSIPAAASGQPATHFEFSTSSSDYPLSNAPWYVSVDQAQTIGRASTDHVLSLAYNALRTVDGEVMRPLLGEHAATFNLESGWCVDDCDPNTMLGNFEFNIGIDSNINSPTVDTADPNNRHLFFTFDMDLKRTELFLGSINDANSAYFEMSGRNDYGEFVFGVRNYPVKFWRVTGTWPDDDVDAGTLQIAPGVPWDDATRSAILDRYYVSNEDDLSIEPGRAPGSGPVGEIDLGHRRPTNVYIGNKGVGGQLHVSNNGVEFTESDVNPTCAADNFSIYADLSEQDIKICDDGVRRTLSGTNTGDVAAGRSLTLTSGDYNADPELYTQTRCLTLDPNSVVTDHLFFRPDTDITLTGIDCIVGSAASLALTLRECDANGVNCTVSEAPITCGMTNTTETGAIDDPTVAAGDYLRVLLGTKTGTPSQAMICATYTMND